ncbi:aminotransferase [Apiospora marii]|uniref:aminotransferase n=1 Tax=Apiospora marii TaxID=335849 RepID=UPI00312EA6EB
MNFARSIIHTTAPSSFPTISAVRAGYNLMKAGATTKSQVVRQEHQGQLLLDVARSTPNNGLLLLREGVQDRVVVATAPIVAELLVQKTNDLIKPPNISNFVRKFLGDGLNIVKSERHRWLRKHSL